MFHQVARAFGALKGPELFIVPSGGAVGFDGPRSSRDAVTVQPCLAGLLTAAVGKPPASETSPCIYSPLKETGVVKAPCSTHWRAPAARG